MGLGHFAEAGVRAEVLPVKTHEDAHDAATAARVEAASMVYFSGGKPAYLAEVLAGTPLFDAIVRALDRGAVYAGCSAGAMVASRSRDPSKGAGTSWRVGLGLVPHVSFGVHWDRVRRLPGLTWWMTSRLPEGTWFLGLDEHTAIVGDGERWEVVGLGEVVARRDGASRIHRPGDRFETLQASR
jgi:cyanophycinase